jgi:hypothetical protein
MQGRTAIRLAALALGIFVLVGLCGVPTAAQDKPLSFEAIANGEGEDMGLSFGVTVVIESYSSDQERQVLVEAFAKGGNKALASTLKTMPVRGQISFSGHAAYPVTYIRKLPTPTGGKIRLVTNRFASFMETQGTSLLTDLNLSVLELDLGPDPSKWTGTFVPACELTLGKNKELELQVYRYPWRLNNISAKAVAEKTEK